MNVFKNVIYSCDFKTEYHSLDIITPVTWSVRNHANILISFSKNIYYYVENRWVIF